MKHIVIQSFNGIGDLLFLTPSLEAIRRAYPNLSITVNTNHPDLLVHNPYVDRIGQEREGVFLGYPDPVHRINPTRHHILSDWEIVCNAFELETDKPTLRPQIYLHPQIAKDKRNGQILVQVTHKGQWHSKKVWPYFGGFVQLHAGQVTPIPQHKNLYNLVSHIAGASCVICAEGAISHIAKAMGTPAVVIYGGWCNPAWNGYEDQVNMTSHMPCGPCYNPDPCPSNVSVKQCYESITPEMVWQIAQRVKL